MSNIRRAAPKIDRKDWRNLPYDKWNTATVHAYFIDMNREMYGVDAYLPFRNWGTERRLIKNALDEHGAELLRAAFDECFRTYRPTREYPILTAGFCVAYRINSIIPRLRAEMAEKERREREIDAIADAEGQPDVGAVKAWL